MCNMVLLSLVAISLSIKQICRWASIAIVNDKKILPDRLWNFIGIGKWTTTVLYNKLTLSYWLVMSWLVMQNNWRQNCYYTLVKNRKINATPTSQAAVRFLLFSLYIKIVKLILPNFFSHGRRALNLEGQTDLSEPMILLCFYDLACALYYIILSSL